MKIVSVIALIGLMSRYRVSLDIRDPNSRKVSSENAIVASLPFLILTLHLVRCPETTIFH